MRKISKEQLKNRVLGILQSHDSEEKAISFEELGVMADVRKHELDMILRELSIKDHIKIRLTGFPCKLYLGN